MGTIKRLNKRTRDKIPILLNLILSGKPMFDDFEFECGLSRPTIGRILRVMEYEGKLTIIRYPGGKRNEYKINGHQL